jgi:hypothetical protein
MQPEIENIIYFLGGRFDVFFCVEELFSTTLPFLLPKILSKLVSNLDLSKGRGFEPLLIFKLPSPMDLLDQLFNGINLPLVISGWLLFVNQWFTKLCQRIN